MEASNINNLPPCSQWNIWEGEEIEGFTDLNVTTLFIRNATRSEIKKYSKSHNRIWLTNEYQKLSKKNIEFLLSLQKHICIDLTLEKYLKLKKKERTDILDNFQVYVRINDLKLKSRDHIKIGDLFYEESFLVGSGKTVDTNLYHNDKFIK